MFLTGIHFYIFIFIYEHHFMFKTSDNSQTATAGLFSSGSAVQDIKTFTISWQIHQNTNFIFIAFVDVLATAAAFVGTTVHQVSLWQTVSNHRCVEVGRTPRLSSLTCLVLSWCVLLSWSISPSCCLLCQSPWRSPSLWRGSKKWHGLWLLTCFALFTANLLVLCV